MIKRALLSLVLFPMAVAPLGAASEVYLGLQKSGGPGHALGVGLLPFTSSSANPEAGVLADKARAVVREDLLFTNYFNIVEGGPKPVSGKLDGLAWTSLGAQVVIDGDVKLEGTTLTLECRILDVGTGKVLFAKAGDSRREALRRLAPGARRYTVEVRY